ncbi:hypothetical protein B0H10DRAFT_1998138 [Mycena sp. CBHHK59/15]|nr:hypothetical protein B0H10DRAFT_1998138 [Mycena sp. CBHHK59/15]
MDHSALFHGHSTAMANVLDLQLADVSSRTVRGEGMEKQLARFSPYFSVGEITSNRAHYTKLHRLLSLSNAMKEHRIRDARTGGVADHAQWMRRPLSSSGLQYAADDVYNISLLFDHFLQQGYIDPSLPARSLKYVRLWSDAPPHPTDVYRSHPILPLEILEPPPPAPPMIMCTGCHRDLRRPSFPSTSPPNQMRCFVCAAIIVKTRSEEHGGLRTGFMDLEDIYLYDDDDGRDDFDLFEDMEDYDPWDEYQETAADFEFYGNSESD